MSKKNQIFPARATVVMRVRTMVFMSARALAVMAIAAILVFPVLSNPVKTASDAGMSEELGEAAPETAGAAADEMRTLEGEFSSTNGDFKADFSEVSADRDKAMIEMEMEINLDEVDEVAPGEGAGVLSVDSDELAILDREQIGIQPRDRLEKLQTPEELSRLRRMERLKPLAINEVDGADRLKPLLPVRNPAMPLPPGSGIGVAQPGIPANYAGFYQPGQGFSRLEPGSEQVNVRNELRPGATGSDLVRMDNSGKLVPEERKEREEFKKRQERRTSPTQPATGSSGLPYLPNGGPSTIQSPISIPSFPGR